MIRTVIVDDEALAREGIRLRLKDQPDVQIVGEATDGPAAVRLIKRLTPDLVFLDVHMPGLDGVQVLERVPPDQVRAVVFLTAYDQYAVKAFEAHALDYLLKPGSGKRLEESLQRARLALSRDHLVPQTPNKVVELLRSRDRAQSACESAHPAAQ